MAKSKRRKTSKREIRCGLLVSWLLKYQSDQFMPKKIACHLRRTCSQHNSSNMLYYLRGSILFCEVGNLCRDFPCRLWYTFMSQLMWNKINSLKDRWLWLKARRIVGSWIFILNMRKVPDFLNWLVLVTNGFMCSTFLCRSGGRTLVKESVMRWSFIMCYISWLSIC